MPRDRTYGLSLTRAVRATEGDEQRGLQIDDGTRVLRGLGAVYYDAADPGTQYWLWDDVVERIAPGAFAAVLATQPDVRSLFNHNVDLPLGRTSAGTLRISHDARGLHYVVDVPETSVGETVLTAVMRGDVSGSSFWFRPFEGDSEAAWSEEVIDEQVVFVRSWVSIGSLIEVGPVVFPAYTATETRTQQRRAHHVRGEDLSRDDTLDDLQRWLASRESGAQKRVAEREARARRLRV